MEPLGVPEQGPGQGIGKFPLDHGGVEGLDDARQAVHLEQEA